MKHLMLLSILLWVSNAHNFWCWSVGDPHFKTFNNDRYDHMRPGRQMLLQFGEYKLYTWHHRRRGPAANSAFQLTRYNQNVAKMSCIEPRLRQCVWKVARGMEKYIEVGRAHNCGRNKGMNTRIPPHCPNWVVRTPKMRNFAFFLKTRNRCRRGHWCEKGWTDLSVRWTGSLDGVQRGMCVKRPAHPCSARDRSSRCGAGGERVPSCPLVKQCCRHYRKKPRLEKSCLEDAGMRCCQGRGRGNRNCCKIYEKHCGIDYECGNNQVCDEKMNLCKKRPIKKIVLKNARPYKDDYKEWTNTRTSNCGGWGRILGGYNIFGKGSTLEKFFKLPCSSNRVRFEFEFLRLDSWDGEEAWLKMNGKEVWRRQGRHNEEGSRNVCGGGWGDSLWDVDLGQIIIRKDTLHLRIGTTLNQHARDESWGIRNLRITAKCAHKRQVKNTRGKRYGKYKNPGRCTNGANQGELGDMGKWIDMKKNDIEQNLRECIIAACMPYDSCNYISCCGPNGNMCIAYNKCPNDPNKLFDKKGWVTTESYHTAVPVGNSEESSALPEKKDHKAYVEAMLAALDEEEESELSEFEPDEEWKDVPEIDLADIEDAPYDEAIPENADETQWVDANIVTFDASNFPDFDSVIEQAQIPLGHEFEFSGFTDAAKDPKEEAMLSSSAETEKNSDEDPKRAFLESLPLANHPVGSTSVEDFDWSQITKLISGGIVFALAILFCSRFFQNRKRPSDYQALLMEEEH